MSQGTLFAFGSVIFFVVFSGAVAYGLVRMKELAERDS
jgi:hypothetical protein